jgi:hypothetical protein
MTKTAFIGLNGVKCIACTLLAMLTASSGYYVATMVRFISAGWYMDTTMTGSDVE